jgi:hypothetical protein
MDVGTIMVHTADVPTEVTSQLSAIDGVSGIVVKQTHPEEFEVEIRLSNFESEVRRSIYAQERALYERFPKSSFHFLVIDASEKANATPVEG